MGKQYTLCLLFNKDLSKTLLIKKAEGKMFAGMFNGLGGKLEEGETPKQAVIREVFEESQSLINLTKPIHLAKIFFPMEEGAVLNKNNTLDVFYDVIDELEIPEDREGKIDWFDVDFALNLKNEKLVGYGNIQYLTNLALINEREIRNANSI